MDEPEWLAARFEAQRTHLRAVAYRMLGSASEAEDAVQEAWLRLARSDTGEVDNLSGWLTTVVARVCLDMLRARRSRHELPLGGALAEPAEPGMQARCVDPEQEAVLADTVGRALLLVLRTLAPSERIAFVLHDTFGVPFVEIGPILERSPEAAKKLAGRARRKVRGRAGAAEVDVDVDLAGHRHVVEAFLAAIRVGDMNALLAVLDADVVRRVDRVGLPPGLPSEVRGARAVVAGARVFSRRARDARPALLNGRPGAVVAGSGQLVLALMFTVADRKITEFEVIIDPDRLRHLEVTAFDQ